MNKAYEKFGKPTKYLRKTLMRRQQGKCDMCKIDEWVIDESFQIHRQQVRGDYHPDNCILLCRSCHVSVTIREKKTI